MRIFYVKLQWLIQSRERSSCLTLVAFTLLMTLVFTVLYETVTKRTASLQDICHGRPQELVATLYDMEFQNHFNFQVHVVIWMGFVTVVVELTCYTVIYLHLIRHNLSMTSVLSRDQVRRRNRKNVINLTGAAVNFFLEVFFLLFFSVDGTVPRQLQFLNRVISQSHYCLIGISTFVFSEVLRKELCSILHNALRTMFKFVGFFNFMGFFGSFYQKHFIYRR